MAIDTRNKRFAAGNLPWFPVLADPDGVIGQPDRYQALGLYPFDFQAVQYHTEKAEVYVPGAEEAQA